MTNEERENLINSILPDTVKGQQRPAENLNLDMPYSTDFPQLISKDPASADVFNLINRQLFSNFKQTMTTYLHNNVREIVASKAAKAYNAEKATASKSLYSRGDYASVLAAAKSRMGDSTRASDIVVFIPSPGGDYSKNNDKDGGTNNAYHALRIAPWLQKENSNNRDTINGVLSDKTSNLRICPSFKPISTNGTIKTLGEVSLTACYYENVGADYWQENMYMTEGKSIGIQLNADTQKLWLSLKSRRNSTTEEESNLYDLGASAIVSQQLGLNGYTKYADGRLKMWGCVYVDRNNASVSSTENPDFKFHENYKTVTFPVTVKEIHNVVAVPNTLHGVYYESCCIRVKDNSSLNVILLGLQRLADDIMGVDNKVWYLLHGTWK